MGKTISVEPSRLTDAAARIEAAAGGYQAAFARLFSEVAAMSNAWQGADNIAYTNQINGFEDDFKRMKDLMDQYAVFLRESAKFYTDTQNNIVQQAAKLVN